MIYLLFYGDGLNDAVFTHNITNTINRIKSLKKGSDYLVRRMDVDKIILSGSAGMTIIHHNIEYLSEAFKKAGVI